MEKHVQNEKQLLTKVFGDKIIKMEIIDNVLLCIIKDNRRFMKVIDFYNFKNIIMNNEITIFDYEKAEYVLEDFIEKRRYTDDQLNSIEEMYDLFL